MEVEKSELGLIENVCRQYGILSLQTQIAACKNLLTPSENINIAVYGKFKAGKSSFLNSVFGKEILPAGVTPITAIITIIRYGENEKIEIVFADDSRNDIPAQQLAEYVSEVQNPQNVKRVKIVEIGLPELKGSAGINFVDTPGLDS